MKAKFQPKKIVKIYCPNCKELQVKLFPNSSYIVDMVKIPWCLKCRAKMSENKKLPF